MRGRGSALVGADHPRVVARLTFWQICGKGFLPAAVYVRDGTCHILTGRAQPFSRSPLRSGSPSLSHSPPLPVMYLGLGQPPRCCWSASKQEVATDMGDSIFLFHFALPIKTSCICKNSKLGILTFKEYPYISWITLKTCWCTCTMSKKKYGSAGISLNVVFL